MGTERSLGRLRPKHAREVTASSWGINFMSPQVADWRPVLERAGALGAKYLRLKSTFWNETERERSVYDWSRSDLVVDYCAANGIAMYANLGVGNPVYNGQHRDTPPQRDAETHAAWRAYVAAAAERYRGRIQYWEMPNEPNQATFWKPGPDARELAAFTVEASRIIKGIDPEAKICAGVVGGGIDLDFARDFLAHDTVPHFDVFVFHCYRTVPEGYANKLTVRAQTDLNELKLTFDKREIAGLSFETEVNALRSLLRSHGFAGPLWQGETGYPSHERTIHWRGDGPWGEQIQAKFLLRRLLTDWCAGVEMSSYFQLMETSAKIAPHMAWGTYPDEKNTKGLLVLEDLRPKPAYFAFQHLCAVFDDVRRDPDAAPDLTITDAGRFPADLADGDVRLHAFRARDDTPLYIWWVPKGMREHTDAGTITLRTPGSLHDPVLVDLVSGDVRALDDAKGNGGTTFVGLPLTDYPLVLAERDAVPLISA